MTLRATGERCDVCGFPGTLCPRCLSPFCPTHFGPLLVCAMCIAVQNLDAYERAVERNSNPQLDFLRWLGAL